MVAGLAAAAGWVGDQVLGEPPARAHPVVWFGTAMRRLESITYADSRGAGALHLLAGVGTGVAAGTALRRLVGPGAATVVATTVSVAGKMLLREATTIVDALDTGRLDDARGRLPTLVGRDVAGLDAAGITRAVIESVAENTVDAVTAPLFWAAVAGAPGVLAHRAVNTLDAMVGHRTPRYERFGWASARVDDAVNWLPARLSAAGVALLVPRSAGRTLRVVRRDASRHPSPNGGVIEAAFAGALDVRLGGSNLYSGETEDRGTLGDGPPPDADAARRAIRLARGLGALAAAVAAAGTGVSVVAGATRLRRQAPMVA